MPERRGYSLIEFLVVLAVISMLLSLLLPAMNGAREAARRSQCANNLKQIGLALNNYHEAANAFPPGWVSLRSPGTGADAGPGWGWLPMMFPMVEQRGVYDTINFSLPIEVPANAKPRVTPINSLTCPSDRRRQRTFFAVGARGVGVEAGEPIAEVAASSYVGCFGSGDPSSLYPFDPSAPPPGRDAGDGMFFRDRSVRIIDVEDGTSQTIAVGERDDSISPVTWTGAITGSAGGPALVVGRAGDREGPNAVPRRPDDFGSGHPGGALFLYVDGSVHFLPSRLPAPIYRALATRAGGETLSEDAY